jgi:hypothetical protein
MNDAPSHRATPPPYAAPSSAYAATTAAYATQTTSTPPIDLERLKVTFGCIAFIVIVVLIGFCLGVVGTLLYLVSNSGGGIPLP